MNSKATTLSLRIATAFPVDSPPSRKQVLYAGANPRDLELKRVRECFGGRPWTSITLAEVFEFRDASPFFSPSALAYFAPAFMMRALEADDQVDAAVESLAGELAASAPTLWSTQQRAVICEWFDYFRDWLLQERYEEGRRAFGCNNGVVPK